MSIPLIRRHPLIFRPSMIRKGGMVTVNPFSETWKRKMNTKPTGPVYFGPFEVTSQVSRSPPPFPPFKVLIHRYLLKSQSHLIGSIGTYLDNPWWFNMNQK